MNIPQVSGSLVSKKAEAHFSAATIYIDWSLFKVQPPTEYCEIGKSLSARRKIEADEGPSHLTAVQLGVLFGGLVPKVPHLIRAYGLRCSEIAKSPKFNPKGSFQHGIFANEVGVDGTSVWAAATSGDASIAVLLLASMLSSIWMPPQAISIWMQLIAERKQAIEASGNLHEQILCKNLSLTRDDIALWQTSTNAWRLTADAANAVRQRQLKLIIDNLGIPVNTKHTLSESVISAWQSAMVTVDALVAGNPQSIQSGAPLLGLTAWHIYSGMVVYHPGQYGKLVEVAQNDPLVAKGGIMTLGLKDMRRSGDGIYWSLPLAHLRYYGRPIQSESLLSSRTSRVSVEDLVYVALGSLIRKWCTSTADIDMALKLLVQLENYVDLPALTSDRRGNSWLSLLASIARSYLTMDESKKAAKLQLIRCGQRRFPLFIADPRCDSIFGLSNPGTLLRMMPGNAARVELLRNVAKDFSDDRCLWIIQCKSSVMNTMYELSSVEKFRSIPQKKRSHDDYNGEIPPQYPFKYLRWVYGRHEEKYEEDKQPDSELIRLAVPIPYLHGMPYPAQWQDAPIELYGYLLQNEHTKRDWLRAKSVTVCSHWKFGDPDVAALYCLSISYWTHNTPNDRPQIIETKKNRSLPHVFVLKHVSMALEHKLEPKKRILDTQSLSAYMNGGEFSKPMLKTLRALLTVSNLYKELEFATVELRVAEKPLYRHSWIPDDDTAHNYPPVGPFSLNRETAFACVARVESGSFNIHPTSMERVVAISNGNSMYVARCLLQDPCGPRSSTAIQRIAGNLGRTGMTFLIFPEAPDIRPEMEEPHLVAHIPFDGGVEDCFTQTSLQLSFTGYTLPIDVGSRGNRDIEACYVEATIQLYDRGNWVADLNILNIFTHRYSRLLPACCNRHEGDRSREELRNLVSIDSWEELLDCPIEIGVIRARGNWQARLAAAALAIQRGHETRIIPDQVCWPCNLALKRLPSRTTNATDQSETIDVDYDTEDDSFAARPEYFALEDSDSETEDLVQASIRKEDNAVPSGDDLSQYRSEAAGHDENIHRNIVYIF